MTEKTAKLLLEIRDVAIMTLFFMAVLSALVFGLRHGLPIQLFVFCAVFVIFFSTGRDVLKNIPHGNKVAAASAVALGSAWIVFPSWQICDITAILIAFAILSRVRGMVTLQQALLLAIAVIIYDVVMVFGTGYMQEAVLSFNGAATPLAITFPPAFAKIIHMQVIGLGDIILPGTMIIAAFDEGKRREMKSIGFGAILGYFVGLIVTVIVLSITQFPQPATLYLYPGVFTGLWIALATKGVPLRSAFAK